MNTDMSRGRQWWLRSVAMLLIFFGTYFFLYPGCRVLWELAQLSDDPMAAPSLAIDLHERLAPKYEAWARARVEEGSAARLTTEDLVPTEWPIFGTTFFLWTTESLQEAWESDPTLSERSPREYAAGAIEASIALILDPGHGKWVRDHWGEDYLHEENVFYRMLLIGGMTSHHNLTGCRTHLDLLREYVDSLAADIDASPSGLLEDYPLECYPADVLAGLACIRRADAVLGTCHSATITNAMRGFSGDALDHGGLVPFLADVDTGYPETDARGSGNSYVSIMAPEVWPSQAADWYALYEEHFWRDGRFVSGFREYYPGTYDGEWAYDDMDAGPVVGGFGMAASAFGVGAARANGRMDHAYTLTAQMIAASWPLPDGTLLVPRILSNAAHAPYLGEACILYNLSRSPAPGVPVVRGGRITPLVWGITSMYFLAAALYLIPAARSLRRIQVRRRPTLLSPARFDKRVIRALSPDESQK